VTRSILEKILVADPKQRLQNYRGILEDINYKDAFQKREAVLKSVELNLTEDPFAEQ